MLPRKAPMLAVLFLLSFLLCSCGTGERHRARRSHGYSSQTHKDGCWVVPEYERRHRRTMRELDRRHWNNLPPTLRREIIRERWKECQQDRKRHRHDYRKPRCRDRHHDWYRGPRNRGHGRRHHGKRHW